MDAVLYCGGVPFAWTFGCGVFPFPFPGDLHPDYPEGGGGSDVIAADTPVVNLVPCEPP